jgi:hypothetical protein
MTAGEASPSIKNILAGIAGSGGTPSLAWFAATGSTLPTDTTTALDAAFKTAGYCAESGLTISTAISSTDINAFGVKGPVRTMITSEKKTGKIGFLESNPITLAVYHRLPVTGAGSPTVTATTGALALTDGPSRSQRYAAIFTATDGVNVIRKVCPQLEVTDIDDEQIAQAAPIQYGVTFTAYPDSSGVSIYTYMLVPNLATA